MKISQKFFNGKTGYVYTNTRVKVMKSKLIVRDDFEKLIKMPLSEIARFLEEREYKKEFDELGRTLSGAILIEYALNKNIENQFSSILRFSIRSALEELKLYLKRFDLLNIKTILRSKLSGISNESIMNEIIAAGELDKNFFKEMIEKAKSFEEAVEFLKNTEYFSIVRENKNSMPKLEDDLDKFYYKILLKNVSKPLKDFMRYEIGVKNASNRARAKKHNLSFEPVKGGKRIKIGETLHDSIESRTLLKKNLLEKALKMTSKFSYDITPIVGYFFAKENEVGNLRVIVRGKQSGLDENTIRKQIISGE